MFKNTNFEEHLQTAASGKRFSVNFPKLFRAASPSENMIPVYS